MSTKHSVHCSIVTTCCGTETITGGVFENLFFTFYLNRQSRFEALINRNLRVRFGGTQVASSPAATVINECSNNTFVFL